MIELESGPHYEMILVAVTKQRIVGGYLIQKAVGAGRQIYITDVDRSEDITVAVVTAHPFIIPSGCGNDSCIFRAFLIIDGKIQFCGGPYPALEIAIKKRELEFWKR